MLAYLATRVLTFIALAAAARHQHRPFSSVVTNWDGNFYASIAANGYPHFIALTPGTGIAAPSTAAFFPLFPLVTTPLTAIGLPFWLAVLIVVTVSGGVASILISLVVRHYCSERVAILAAICWCVFPLAGVLSVAYSEALLTMLAAGCVLALLERHWAVAGLLALLAGATRPTGAVLAVVAVVAAALAIRRDREWRSLVAVILAPLGTLATWIYIGWRAGRLDAWFVIENGGWGARFDGGVDTFQSVGREFSGSTHVKFAAIQGLAILSLFVLVVIAVVMRPPAVVMTYLIVGFVLAVGTANLHASIPRFLLVVFPILVPVANLLDRSARPVRIAVLLLAGLVSAAVGAWYFAFATFAP